MFAGSVDENRDTLVDVFGKICIAFGAEDRAGSRIGIEELEVAGG